MVYEFFLNWKWLNQTTKFVFVESNIFSKHDPQQPSWVKYKPINADTTHFGDFSYKTLCLIPPFYSNVLNIKMTEMVTNFWF